MQILIGTSQTPLNVTAPGCRVMLLTDRPEGETGRRLARYGSLLDIQTDMEPALATLTGDALGYDLFVMDCDGFGGVEGAECAIARLIAADARMRVLLVSREFDAPAYPLGRRTAVCLPEDASDDEFRYGYDHVLRDRAPSTYM